MKGQTPWPAVTVIGILGLLWLTVAGPATCKTYGRPATVQIEATATPAR